MPGRTGTARARSRRSTPSSTPTSSVTSGRYPTWRACPGRTTYPPGQASAQHRGRELPPDVPDQLVGPLLQVAGRAFGRPLREHREVAEREPGRGQPGAEPRLDVGHEPAQVTTGTREG